ncbi:hypothetical protein OIU79_025216 [Salix purpurea]|uniref:Uncharacterized protein n=1 Tax=Salix purpurea TaxID=77065 RepID=A0A9Q0W4N9_SALPP|nr:hypothetical protein OIU79_025216 [Salix purpurea]
MYAETWLLFPYMQDFSQDIQQLEEYCKCQKNNASMGLELSFLCTSIWCLLSAVTCAVWFLRKWGASIGNIHVVFMETQFKVHIFLGSL